MTDTLKVTEKQTAAPYEGEPTREGLTYVPQVDIFETADAIHLQADLPGARKDSVTIDLRDGVLTLSASVPPLPSNWQPRWQEYQVGGFTRRFTLGERIDQEKISAEMQDGVLHVTLPKAEAHRPRKIAVS